MELHHDQCRKDTTIPYITHLWSVAAIVGEHGGTEAQVIAALLHDAIEDQGNKITVENIRERFGQHVAEIVKDCSDADTIPKPPWKERKERHLDHLKHAPPHVKLVSAADKLHNTRAILGDLRVEGAALWKRFNAGTDEELWYYRGVVEALRYNWSHRVVDELELVVQDIERLVRSQR